MAKNMPSHRTIAVCLSTSWSFSFAGRLVNSEQQSARLYAPSPHYWTLTKRSIANWIMRKHDAPIPKTQIGEIYDYILNLYKPMDHVCLIIENGHELAPVIQMLAVALTTGVPPKYSNYDGRRIKVPIKLIVIHNPGPEWNREDTLAVQSLCSVEHTLICHSSSDGIQTSWTTKGMNDMVVRREFWGLFIPNKKLQKPLPDNSHQLVLDQVVAYQARFFLHYNSFWRRNADVFDTKHTWKQERSTSTPGGGVIDPDVQSYAARTYHLARYRAPAWLQVDERPQASRFLQTGQYSLTLEWTVWSSTCTWPINIS